MNSPASEREHARYLDTAKNVIQVEIEGLEKVSSSLGEDFIASVTLLLDCLREKGKIIVVGVGKSGNICHKVAATLNSTGATSVVLDSQNALHGDLGMVDRGDVVIAMSYSGETVELIRIIPFLKRMGLPMIALTSKPGSTLGKHSDYVLDSSVDKEACPLNLAPTSSSTAMLALGDALAMVLLEARGFTKEEFAQYHPGGALGSALLTTVKDIMRPREGVACVQEGARVLEALHEMSDKKSGACIVLRDDDLSGVITHGDFVRHYTVNHDIGETIVAEVMTKSPITIKEEMLAAEAVNILREHRIDDIIVLNAVGKPSGIIDSQDLARHHLV